jgi:predicted DNA-binding transcriptional regulator YafY
MSQREVTIRRNLIINKLKKQPSTFNEIHDALKRESELQEYDFTVSKRTFQRDLEDIRSIYSIDIQFDFSRKVYFIEDEQPEVSGRILEAFDTFNALNIANGLSNYLHFEKRKPIGTEHLYGLLHAIKNNVSVKFTYQKYWEDTPNNRQVEPYALKEFKNRWYILSKDLKDGMLKTFSLDRMTNLEITTKKFLFPKNFNVNDYYNYSFGIITPEDEEYEEVILSFSPFQGKYIKSLPLHESQKVLIDNQKELRVRIDVYVTYDLIMELMSYGEELKVIEPQWLIDDMKKRLMDTLKRYE